MCLRKEITLSFNDEIKEAFEAGYEAGKREVNGLTATSGYVVEVMFVKSNGDGFAHYRNVACSDTYELDRIVDEYGRTEADKLGCQYDSYKIIRRVDSFEEERDEFKPLPFIEAGQRVAEPYFKVRNTAHIPPLSECKVDTSSDFMSYMVVEDYYSKINVEIVDDSVGRWTIVLSNDKGDIKYIDKTFDSAESAWNYLADKMSNQYIRSNLWEKLS